MRIVVPAAVLFVGLSVRLLAFKEGPYPNVAGGFGDPSCHSCHLDNTLNAAGGTLTVAGVPPAYTPGARYTITVTLARAGMARGGFEIAARFAIGHERGRQAGRWRPLDARVQLIHSQADPALEFVQHNLAGSRAPARGANSWTLEWTAPAAAGAPVQFDIAGNATNDDDSPLGDYIYLKEVRSPPANEATDDRRPTTAGGPPMSLTRIVVAGAVGGFLSIFTSWLITGVLFHRYQQLTPETWRPEGPVQYTLASLIEVAAGGAIGLLFYLVRGIRLAGHFGWPGAGVHFAVLAWLAFAVPTLLTTAVFVRIHRGVVVGLLLDSLTNLVLVSIACAWAAS